MRRRFSGPKLELGKTILLVLLIASALVLAREAGVFSQIFSSAASGDSTAKGETSQGPGPGTYTAAAMPFVMAVTREDGLRLGAIYGDSETRALYYRFFTPLGEALGSAGEPQEVTEDTWRTALGAPGVFFDYLYGQPLAALAGWPGTAPPAWAGTTSARRICVCAEGEETALYYISADSGKFYRCDTSASALKLEGFVPNSARFVFEADDGSYSGIDPYTLLVTETPSLTALEVKNPVGGSVTKDELLGIFGFNNFVTTSYTNADGTTVYMEGRRALKAYTDGTLDFQGDGETFRLQGDLSLSAMVQAAFDFVSRSAGKWAGAAELWLSGTDIDETAGKYRFHFDYVYGGVPIVSGEGSAVTVTIENGAITEIQMRVRSYSTPSGTDALTPLPQGQELAVIEGQGGGEPILVYEDSGSAVTAQWYKEAPNGYKEAQNG